MLAPQNNQVNKTLGLRLKSYIEFNTVISTIWQWKTFKIPSSRSFSFGYWKFNTKQNDREIVYYNVKLGYIITHI